MYFKPFPKTTYDYPSVNAKDQELVDVLRRTRFLFNNTFTDRPYSYYNLEPGDTCDIIAKKVYGDSEWWWLVLLYNDIVNPFLESYNNKADLNGFIERSSSSVEESVFYIERIDGDNERDFQSDDIIVLGTDSSENSITTSGGTNYTSPIPLNAEDKRAAVKIKTFKSSYRSAVVSGRDSKKFSEGDLILVLEDADPNDSYSARSVVWGRILKITSRDDEVIDFVDNNSGRNLPPNWNVRQLSVEKTSPKGIIGGDSGICFADTIIGGILKMSGSSGNTYSNQYSAITFREIGGDQERINRIKLLDDSYKFQAYDLLKTSITSEVGDIQTYSSTGLRVVELATPSEDGDSSSLNQRVY